MRISRSASMAALLAVAAATAEAHDTWVLPSKPVVSPGSTLALDLTSGMAFSENDHGPKADRISSAMSRLAGQTVAIGTRVEVEGALRLSVPLASPGVATIWVETKPKEIELRPEQVGEYLAEIGAADTVGKAWKASGQKTWRELYTKLSKAFVRVGDPTGDTSWSKPVGQALEIVPENDPTALTIGGELTVRVSLHGEPLRDFPLGLVAAGERGGVLRRTDSAGRVVFRLDRSGWWLLRGTRIVRSKQPEADWESHFVTLTIFVTRKR